MAAGHVASHRPRRVIIASVQAVAAGAAEAADAGDGGLERSPHLAKAGHVLDERPAPELPALAVAHDLRLGRVALAKTQDRVVAQVLSELAKLVGRSAQRPLHTIELLERERELFERGFIDGDVGHAATVAEIPSTRSARRRRRKMRGTTSASLGMGPRARRHPEDGALSGRFHVVVGERTVCATEIAAVSSESVTHWSFGGPSSYAADQRRVTRDLLKNAVRAAYDRLSSP